MNLGKIVAGVALSFSLFNANADSSLNKLEEEANLTPYVFSNTDEVYFYYDINKDGVKDRIKVYFNCDLKEYPVCYDLIANLGCKNGFSKDNLIYRFGPAAPKNISFFEKEENIYLSFEQKNSLDKAYQKKIVKIKKL